MSWLIWIGETEDDDPQPDHRQSVRVREAMQPGAPAFFADPPHSNCLRIDLDAFERFTRRVHLHEMFFGGREGVPLFGDGRKGLVAEHRSIAPLLRSHLGAVIGSLSRPQSDGDRAVLLWLKWWMTWALRTCRRPAAYSLS